MQPIEQIMSDLKEQVLAQEMQVQRHEHRIINLETHYVDVANLLNQIQNNLNKIKYFVGGGLFVFLIQQFGLIDMLKVIM